jgi:polyhydroxyalkanoate synthase
MTNAYLYGYRLSAIYNSVYIDTFYGSLKEGNRELFEDIRAKMMEGKSSLTEMNLLAFNYSSSIYERWIKDMDKAFATVLRSEEFLSSLSKYVDSVVDLHSIYRQAGYPVDSMDTFFNSNQKQIMSFLSISKKFDLTPHEILHTNGKVRLLHYVPYKGDQKNEDGSKSTTKPSLLMIYAPINRFHILDINQDKSVVAQFLRKGIDVYLLDWGYPDKNEDRLSINDYINYIDEAVHIIQKQETNPARSNGTSKDNNDKSNKVSLLGYCWGGVFALIYCALNNSIIQNLILMATPVDFSKDNTILAEWSRVLDTERIVEEFGHIDGQILDLGFIMRNPPRYLFDKYLKFFRKLNDKLFVDIFLSVERWLYDTPPIPGNLYHQLINDCYRKNMLVSNSMYVDGRQIDLRKINIPLLSIVAEKDDLASPESSLAVNNYVSSKDKTDMKNPGGHVGLCISSPAHEKLWPEVTEWILAHN